MNAPLRLSLGARAMARAAAASRAMRERVAQWLLKDVHLKDVRFGEHSIDISPGGADEIICSNALLVEANAAALNLGTTVATDVNLSRTGQKTTVKGQAVIKAKVFAAGTADLVMANATTEQWEKVAGTSYGLSVSMDNGNVCRFQGVGLFGIWQFAITQFLTQEIFLVDPNTGVTSAIQQWSANNPVALAVGSGAGSCQTSVTLQPVGTGTVDVTHPQARQTDQVEAVVSTSDATPTNMLPGSGYAVTNNHAFNVRVRWNARNTGGGAGVSLDSMSGVSVYNVALNNTAAAIVVTLISSSSGGDPSVAAATVTLVGIGGTNAQMVATGVAGTNIAFEAWLEILAN